MKPRTPLPALLVDCCAAHGPEVAFATWRRLGGQIISTWTEAHTRALAGEIGAAAALDVGAFFAARGGVLDFSTTPFSDLVRDAKVHAMAANGLPPVAIAAVVGVSQRTVARILAARSGDERRAA